MAGTDRRSEFAALVRRHIARVLFRWLDRFDPAERVDPFDAALRMVEAAARADSRPEAVRAVHEVLRTLHESDVAPAAIHLASLLGHPTEQMPYSPLSALGWASLLRTRMTLLEQRLDRLAADEATFWELVKREMPDA